LSWRVDVRVVSPQVKQFFSFELCCEKENMTSLAITTVITAKRPAALIMLKTQKLHSKYLLRQVISFMYNSYPHSVKQLV